MGLGTAPVDRLLSLSNVKDVGPGKSVRQPRRAARFPPIPASRVPLPGAGASSRRPHVQNPATRLTALAVGAGVSLATFTASGPAGARTVDPERPDRHVTIRNELHHDASPALRTITPVPGDGELEHEPVRVMPQRSRTHRPDPVIQRTAGTAVPVTSANFDGVGEGFVGPQGTYSVTGVPPDPHSAVGATQVVEVVNTAFAVFSKTGTVQYGPVDTSTLWSGFGGFCQTTNDGDA